MVEHDTSDINQLLSQTFRSGQQRENSCPERAQAFPMGVRPRWP